MKKKVIAVAQYIALLMTSVFPATALAEGGTEQEAPVCICENKCSEGNMNADCPVCSAAADFSACQGQEPQPMNEQGGGDTTPADGQGGSAPDGQGDGGSMPMPAPTAPVCVCTVKCSEGAADTACPVCSAEGADLNACTGKAAEDVDQEDGSSTPTPVPTPTAPACTCMAKCSEGAVSADCPVCAADWNNCAFTGETGKPEEDNKPEIVTVTDWSWVDEQGILADDGKLYLPSAVTAENLEGIKASLPQYIQAGEEKIALTWTYDEATGIFTAALPEGYALAEGAKALTIETVDMGADTLEEIRVTYIDANGVEQTVGATVVTAESTLENTGWVMVNKDITIDSRVKIIGDVNLILADGCTLTATDGIEVEPGNILTIYAQANGTGALFANGHTDRTAGIGGSGYYVDGNANCGTVNIYGGNITATGATGAAAISDQSGKTAGAWSGIIFEGDAGAVYGNQSNGGSFTIATGQTLDILSGSSFTNCGTLTIDGALTNNGPVTVPMAGSFVNNRTLNCTYHSFYNGNCVLGCGGTAVSSVTMSRTSLRIYEGGSYTLSATVSPADAADKSIVWSSSDESIATVDQDGKVTGKAPGVCTIYAQARDGSGAYASCTVRVLRWYPGAPLSTAPIWGCG